MVGDGGVEVSLAKVVVKECSDGPRRRVGIQVVGVVADHAADVQQKVWRENVLVRRDAHGLEVIGGLKLGRCARWNLKFRKLLEIFVGYFEAREFVADAECEAVCGSEFSVVAY